MGDYVGLALKYGALLLKGRRYEIWLVLHVAPLVQRGLCQVAGGCLAEDAGIRHVFCAGRHLPDCVIHRVVLHFFQLSWELVRRHQRIRLPDRFDPLGQSSRLCAENV